MFRNKCLKIIMISLFTICITSISFAGSKVGYIDLQRLVKESMLGKAAMEDIELLRKKKQIDISAKLKNINDIKLDLETNNELLKNEEKKDKIEQLNTLIKEYKRMVADAKEEIAKQDRELVAQILAKADGALKKVAQKKKFTIILKDPNAIGYLDPSVDITGDVLGELNKQ